MLKRFISQRGGFTPRRVMVNFCAFPPQMSLEVVDTTYRRIILILLPSNSENSLVSQV
jgi:hypothetical protein